MDADAQDEVLRAGGERLTLRGQGFKSLRTLCFMGYYRDARTWPMLGYEGPLPPGRPTWSWWGQAPAARWWRARRRAPGCAWSRSRRARTALPTRDFTQREDEMLPRLFQDGGGRTTDDGAITVLQGRGVGGSTVHNTNLCKRAPGGGARRLALDGWGAAELAPHYEVVERDLSVAPIEESRVNRNNAILRRGVEKLGWRGGMLRTTGAAASARASASSAAPSTPSRTRSRC